MRPYVSVIISAYNEEGVIEDHINQVGEFLYRHLGPDKTFEIIVVNDGSNDSTGAIIDRLALEREYLIAEHHPRNLGRGRGIRTGFARSTGRYVFTLDADLSYSPDHVARMLPPLESGETDVVLASVYHPEGHVKNVPFGRALISRVGNRLLSVSLGGELHTVTCVVRGYTRDVIDSLTLFSDGKDIHLEIIQKARMLGFKIIEIPAELRWRVSKRTGGTRGWAPGDFMRLVSRHLFFNFLFRPSLLCWIPMGLLGALFLVVSFTIVHGYTMVLSQTTGAEGFTKYYLALREHILLAKVSYFGWSLVLVLLFQFASLVFIAKQNNHHFEEIFSFLSFLRKRVENLEEKK